MCSQSIGKAKAFRHKRFEIQTSSIPLQTVSESSFQVACVRVGACACVREREREIERDKGMLGISQPFC